MTRADVSLLLPDLGGGGAERVALTLANAFAARGQRVELLLMRRSGALLPLLRPEVEVVDLAAPKIRAVPPRLARHLRRSRPRALLVFMWPLTVAAVLARTLARTDTRLVLSDHSTLSRQYGSPRSQRLLRWTVRAFYPRAEVRAIVSEDAADDLARLTGLPRASITVLHNPLALPPLPLPRSTRAEQDWRGTGRRILTVGSLKPEKQHDCLLRAFARLPGSPSLMILGGGDLLASLEALAEELGIADRVAFPGFTADPWPHYASADLFVLSSRFEGLPLVLVEALHAGLPVVSTDCRSGPREILADGAFGALVPPGDEAALAAAMEAALQRPHDPEPGRRRAQLLGGEQPLCRFAEVLRVDARSVPADAA